MSPMRLRLYENYRFVLYAPFYAAHATGTYAAEGIEVQLSASPGPDKAEQALIDGSANVLWAGPMRVIKHHADNPGSPLVRFAEVVCSDAFSIVGRHPNSGFRPAGRERSAIGANCGVGECCCREHGRVITGAGAIAAARCAVAGCRRDGQR